MSSAISGPREESRRASIAQVKSIDADALWDEPIVVDDADAVGVLTSQEEFRGVSDLTRARMLRAASAARDLRTLRGLLGDTAEPPPRLARALDRDEQPRAIDDFPLAEVPFERRGLVAEAAVRAWSRDLIPRDAAARYLGVTPGSEIERVADYFGEPAAAGARG